MNDGLKEDAVWSRLDEGLQQRFAHDMYRTKCSADTEVESALLYRVQVL